MLACNTVVDRLERFVDGELSESERREVEGHLLACEMCEARIEQLTGMREMLRESVRDAIREADFDGFWAKVETEVEKPRALTSWERFVERLDQVWARFSPVMIPAGAVAAAALVVALVVGLGQRDGQPENGNDSVRIVKVDPGDFVAVEISPGDTKVVVFIDEPPGSPVVSGPH